MRFAIFPLHLSKVLRLPRKIDARSYEVLHLSRKIILANLQIWCSKMQTLSGNQRPDLLTSLMNMSFVLRLPRKMHLSRSSSNAPRLPSFLDMPQNPHVFLTFDKVHTIPCAGHAKQHLNVQKWSKHVTACAFSTSQLQKVLRAWCFVHFDLEMCFGHNGVHFFDISTSKSAPRRVFFVHFDLEMCFAPQQRALFRHLNFQKWSGAEVFCKFWLRNALRAATACTFSTSQLLKPELRCFVHLDLEICFAPQLRAIFHLSSPQTAPHPPTFRPSGATNHWRTQCFATLLPFRAPASSVFWLDSFSSLIFFLFFSSLTLHTSAFSSVHIVGSLTSKLPSIISYIL